MFSPLGQRQVAVLVFVREYRERHGGRYPSRREIATRFHWRLSVAHIVVARLRERNFLVEGIR